MKLGRFLIFLMTAFLICTTTHAGLIDTIKDTIIKIIVSGPPTPHTIYTPKGTAVFCLKINEEMSPAEKTRLDDQTRFLYPQATILRSSTEYYTNRIWLNAPEESKYWKDGSYRQVSTLNEVMGAKIRYGYGIDHSAILVAPHDILVSKWGKGPLVRHYMFHCPYAPPINLSVSQYVRNY